MEVPPPPRNIPNLFFLNTEPEMCKEVRSKGGNSPLVNEAPRQILLMPLFRLHATLYYTFVSEYEIGYFDKSFTGSTTLPRSRGLTSVTC